MSNESKPGSISMATFYKKSRITDAESLKMEEQARATIERNNLKLIRKAAKKNQRKEFWTKHKKGISTVLIGSVTSVIIGIGLYTLTKDESSSTSDSTSSKTISQMMPGDSGCVKESAFVTQGSTLVIGMDTPISNPQKPPDANILIQKDSRGDLIATSNKTISPAVNNQLNGNPVEIDFQNIKSTDCSTTVLPLFYRVH